MTGQAPELVLDGGGPIAEQIEGQVRQLVLCGMLVPGEELPTVREVAVGLGVSPHPVEQAYHRLEQSGIVTRGELAGPRIVRPRDAPLRRMCSDFLRAAAQAGYPAALVLGAFQACLEEEMSS